MSASTAVPITASISAAVDRLRSLPFFLPLLSTFLSDLDFYCTVPQLSRAYQRAMRNDALHAKQCQHRLGMTEKQLELFRASTFRCLYRPVGAAQRVCDLRQSLERLQCDVGEDDEASRLRLRVTQIPDVPAPRSAVALLAQDRRLGDGRWFEHEASHQFWWLAPHEKEQYQRRAEEERQRYLALTDGLVEQQRAELTRCKCWWLECTRLFLHIRRTTRHLTRHAPNYFRAADGHLVRLHYQLPALVRALIIDELTSFYVFNIARRYADDDDHSTVMLENSPMESLPSTTTRCWVDWATHPAKEEVDVEEHGELFYRCAQNLYDSDDNAQRLSLMNEGLMLGESTIHCCGEYEYMAQLLWIGPALKATADALTSQQRPGDPPTEVTVDLERCPVFQCGVRENFDFVPFVIADSVAQWLPQGGMSLDSDITEWESYRLSQFVHHKAADERWRAEGRTFADDVRSEAEQSIEGCPGDDPYAEIGKVIEKRQDWWKRERASWINRVRPQAAQLGQQPSRAPVEADTEALFTVYLQHVVRSLLERERVNGAQVKGREEDEAVELHRSKRQKTCAVQ